ncbi:MAG: hypothetical protein ACE5HF_05895 [Gemmatimonadota bacterium]
MAPPRAHRLGVAGVAALAFLTAGGAGARAQEADSAAVARPRPFPTGRIVADVPSRADSSQRYALYLPTAYDARRAWPALLVMDPRGRALLPLQRLVGVAEALGYVVVSSYNTRSDGPTEPTRLAVNAMLGDLARDFTIDRRRLYLVGFSGTTRISWAFAYALQPHVAGVIGFGAGPPEGVALADLVTREGTPFVFFGGTGRTDFNFDEVVLFEDDLRAAGVRHRLEFFDGPHRWPGSDVLREAVIWLELEAMRAGLRPKVQAWIEREHERRLGEAEALEREGREGEAWRAYRQIVADFRELVATDRERSRLGELFRVRDVRRWASRRTRVAKEYAEWEVELLEMLDGLESGPTLPPDSLLARLGVGDLLRSEAEATDAADSLAARRRVETLYVEASFYRPRALRARGEHERARAMLEVARTLRPERPRVCYDLAAVLTALRRDAEAIRALECFAAGVRIDVPRLAADTAFTALHGTPAFEALLERLRSAALPEP